MTWTREQIRNARACPLHPVLHKLGYKMDPTGGKNYRVHIPRLGKEVLIKDHYWRSPDDGSAGNAIDFFVKLHGLSFQHTMELLVTPLPS
jgi:hypothetical protein